MEAQNLRLSLMRKLFLIYSLNTVDWICTVVLLRTGGFYEANPLMQPIIGNLSLGLTVKGILPLLAILLIIRMIGRIDRGELYTIDRIVAFVLAFYTVLCGVHVVNFLLWNMEAIG